MFEFNTNVLRKCDMAMVECRPAVGCVMIIIRNNNCINVWTSQQLMAMEPLFFFRQWINSQFRGLRCKLKELWCIK